MDKQLSHQDSLDIITSMISKAKGNVGQGAFHMILWGWVIMLISLAHFILIELEIYRQSGLVWLLVVPFFFVSFFVGYKKGRNAGVKTILDTIYMWIWLSYALMITLVWIFLYNEWHIIAPVILAISGYATFLSGTVIRFKPMIFGGLAFWFWAVVAYFVDGHYGLLITSIAILVGYLIPGILLQRKTK